MRKIGLLLASALGLAALAAPAQAVTIDGVSGTFTQGATDTTDPVNNGKSIQNFDSYTPNAYISNNTQVFDASNGNGIRPNGSTGNFAAVLGGGSYTLDLVAAPVVSFLAGSIDAYNTVVLSLTNGTSATFAGSDIGTIGQDGRVTFDTGSASVLIDAITFSSSTNSFEIDNIVSAAPEAATWMMMILGFGIVGGALRSRRQATLAAA